MVPIWLLTCQAIWCATPTAEPERATLPVCRYTFGPEEDRDLDDIPDDWVRRKGPGFPRYVTAEIDHTEGCTDDNSLRIQANGGSAVYYSPLVPVDSLHTYYFEGRLRTERLKHDAAVVSVSLLNQRRQRVERLVSVPVLGDHHEWVPVRIGPIKPPPGVRFAVIGCHLVPGADSQRDIGGTAWFDDLSLGQLPRMELESNYYHHFLSSDAPVKVDCQVSGLDAGHEYEVHLSLWNGDGKLAYSTREPLTPDPPVDVENRHLTEFLEPQALVWELPPQAPGFYSVSSTLHRDRQPVQEHSTTLTVLQLVDKPRTLGEFGWTVSEELAERERLELPQIAAQAGINWLKYPVWRMAWDEGPQAAGDVAVMLDRLSGLGVTPVALLSNPPSEIRSQFARDWDGVNEVFSLSPDFWKSSLEPVVARYSSTVQYWQLGGDTDTSFVGSQSLSTTLGVVRDEIRKISLKAAVGVAWRWESAPPKADAAFLSMTSSQLLAPPDLTRQVTSAAGERPPRWVLIRLSQLPDASPEDRAAELARQMVAARVAGAKQIFVDEVYHPQHGLLYKNGAPTPLFLPWRTVALELQGAEYLGELGLPGGSSNAVFVRDGRASVVVWNRSPTTETLYVGAPPIECDLWGRQKALTLDPENNEATFETGPVPKLLLNCSAPILRWMLTTRFEVGQVRSEYGGHNDALLLTNTFPQGVSGQVSLELPPDWEAEPREWTIAAAAGETVRLPFFLRLPANANLGRQQARLQFRIDGDRPYRFRVSRPYVVGLGDIGLQLIDRKLPDGRLEIEQIVTNRTDPPETLDFRCTLFVPDLRRQRLQITRLGSGVDHKFYHLPNAERLRGQTLWLRLEQDGGRRIMNYRWTVGQDW